MSKAQTMIVAGLGGVTGVLVVVVLCRAYWKSKAAKGFDVGYQAAVDAKAADAPS